MLVNRHQILPILFLTLTFLANELPAKKRRVQTTQNPNTVKKCMNLDKTLRARNRVCFLRPDTGPCRADIPQWYFDVQLRNCFRFFWGGCQGNGNRFETRAECKEHCYLNTTNPPVKIPFFCNLAFDYGSCFAEYERWTYDKFTKSCRLRLYSGCGGNQNNFQTEAVCRKTCLQAPDSTFSNFHATNICVPFNMEELN